MHIIIIIIIYFKNEIKKHKCLHLCDKLIKLRGTPGAQFLTGMELTECESVTIS